MRSLISEKQKQELQTSAKQYSNFQSKSKQIRQSWLNVKSQITAKYQGLFSQCENEFQFQFLQDKLSKTLSTVELNFAKIEFEAFDECYYAPDSVNGMQRHFARHLEQSRAEIVTIFKPNS